MILDMLPKICGVLPRSLPKALGRGDRAKTRQAWYSDLAPSAPSFAEGYMWSKWIFKKKLANRSMTTEKEHMP